MYIFFLNRSSASVMDLGVDAFMSDDGKIKGCVALGLTFPDEPFPCLEEFVEDPLEACDPPGVAA